MCSHGDLQVQVDLPSLSSTSDEPQDTHSLNLKHVIQALGIGIYLPKTSSTVSSTKTDVFDVDMYSLSLCVCSGT
jgi:hypothetical protein